MYRNYKSSNLLETRPDIDLLTTFSEPVYGLFFYEVGGNTQLIVHSGTKLYKLITSSLTKNDNLNEFFFSKNDFILDSAMSDTTFEWRYAAVGIVKKVYAKFITNQSKKYLVINNYEITLTPSESDELCGVWVNTTGNKYEFIEDLRDVPSAFKTGKILTNYGIAYFNFGHDFYPQNVPTATLPSIFYKFTKTELTPSPTINNFSMKPAKSNFFVYNNILYIKDGIYYLQYDGTTLTSVLNNAYIPTTSISRTPNGGGTIYEDANMLSIYRKNTFVGDGESTVYHLDVPSFDNVNDIVVKVEGTTKTKTTDYTFDYSSGTVTFTTAPDAPDTDGRDNVEITFPKTVANEADKILKCTLLTVFDNRVFFSGNQDYPNVVWHSSLDNPGYCSDLDYYNEGLDLSPVKSMVAGNNALWVFKKPSQANTTVFYHVPTIDATYGKIYPNSHSGISTGCIATGINFNDDICFFSDRGLEGISGDITSEQVVAHRSSFIDNKLLSEANYERMICDEWEGYLLVFIGNKVYLADSRQVTAVNGSYEYDWYYWELDKNVTSTCIKDGILYLGCQDGIYSLTNYTNNVNNYWITPKDTFGYGNYQKITNKRGCIIECEGADINVYASTNKDAIELIKNYTDVTDYAIARIKKKKFKDLQLKISSSKNMKLESIMIEAYIGAYIKR